MEVPGIEPGASCMLSTRSTTELHPPRPFWAVKEHTSGRRPENSRNYRPNAKYKASQVPLPKALSQFSLKRLAVCLLKSTPHRMTTDWGPKDTILKRAHFGITFGNH